MAKRVERLIEGVVVFESLRLSGFESNKFDSELIKLLEMANKVRQNLKKIQRRLLRKFA